MGQLVGEVTVVGQNEQAFAVFIESTGAEHSLPLKVGRKQVEDGPICVGVGVGVEKALRFVHGHGNRRCLGALRRLFLTNISSPGNALSPRLTVLPLTRTDPFSIRRSASRREQRPDWAINF